MAGISARWRTTRSTTRPRSRCGSVPCALEWSGWGFAIRFADGAALSRWGGFEQVGRGIEGGVEFAVWRGGRHHVGVRFLLPRQRGGARLDKGVRGFLVLEYMS
jgi:hypothetical protein